MADEFGGLRYLLNGLCPGQWYRYGFFAGSGDEWTGRSLLGEFRAALADDAVESVTVAISACNHIENRPWPALQVTADEYYDVFLHLGDMAYNDGATDLAAYRASWHEYLQTEHDGQVERDRAGVRAVGAVRDARRPRDHEQLQSGDGRSDAVDVGACRATSRRSR
jgi:hypothetical protein